MKETSKILIPVITIIVVLAMVIAGFKIQSMNNETDNNIIDKTNPTENTVDATAESGAYLDLVDMTTPEFQLIMPENPKTSMSEFFTGVDRNNRITFAYLHFCEENADIITRITYQIDMFRQKSNISNENRYFIEIDTQISDGMGEDSIVVQVNDITIDDTWNVIEMAITEYNGNARSHNAGEIEYDKDTWIDVFKMIEIQLTENNIPIAEKVDDMVIIDDDNTIPTEPPYVFDPENIEYPIQYSDDPSTESVISTGSVETISDSISVTGSSVHSVVLESTTVGSVNSASSSFSTSSLGIVAYSRSPQTSHVRLFVPG